MKYIFILLVLMSCGERGKRGIPGLSLVVDVIDITTEEGLSCKRTDIFQDVDRNNYYSPHDVYQNGFLTCDGKVGDKGDTGETGESGETAYSIVGIYDPCGSEHPNGYDEVILELKNGTYLASFSDNPNGKNTRLGVLVSGTYQTTDGTNCVFTVE